MMKHFNLTIFVAIFLVRIAGAQSHFPEAAKLTASDGMGGDWLGYSVASSGNTIVVGAARESISEFYQGAAYVFVKPASGWSNMTETAELSVFGGAVNSYLGMSVAISGDTIVVGAPGTESGQGAAYVYVKPRSGWETTSQPTAVLLPSYHGSGFGSSVAIVGDVIAVGAPSSTFGSNYSQGAAYVFVKPNAGWTDMTPTAELTASDGHAADGLGLSIALSGNTVLAGAYSATVGSNEGQGAAYIFSKPRNEWNNTHQIAKLTASDGLQDDRLGVSVSINGSTAVAGVPNKTVGFNTDQGAAYVFAEPSGGWTDMTQTAELTASDGEANDAFSFASVVSGNTIIVGSPFAMIGSNPYQGAVYIYSKPSGGWMNTSHPVLKLKAPDGATDDNFGFSVIFNGDTIVSGAAAEYPSNSIPGAAYVFAY